MSIYKYILKHRNVRSLSHNYRKYVNLTYELQVVQEPWVGNPSRFIVHHMILSQLFLSKKLRRNLTFWFNGSRPTYRHLLYKSVYCHGTTSDIFEITQSTSYALVRNSFFISIDSSLQPWCVRDSATICRCSAACWSRD